MDMDPTDNDELRSLKVRKQLKEIPWFEAAQTLCAVMTVLALVAIVFLLVPAPCSRYGESILEHIIFGPPKMIIPPY